MYCIYEIKIEDYVYYGSTVDFKARIRRHKSCCYNKKSKKYNYRVYKKIRELGAFDKCEINIIEDKIETEKEAISIERFYVESFNPEKLLNKDVPGRTQKEYSKTEKFKANQKEYQKTEKYKAYQKEYQKTEKAKTNKKEFYKKII